MVWYTGPSPTPAPGVNTARSAPTIAEHLGFATIDDGPDVQLDDVAVWVNDFDILHGGVWACMAEIAGAQTIAEQNPHLNTAQVHTVYFRSATPGAPVSTAANVVHVGGRFAVAQVSGLTADGTLCTLSTVTARRVEDLASTGTS